MGKLTDLIADAKQRRDEANPYDELADEFAYYNGVDDAQCAIISDFLTCSERLENGASHPQAYADGVRDALDALADTLELGDVLKELRVRNGDGERVA